MSEPKKSPEVGHPGVAGSAFSHRQERSIRAASQGLPFPLQSPEAVSFREGRVGVRDASSLCPELLEALHHAGCAAGVKEEVLSHPKDDAWSEDGVIAALPVPSSPPSGSPELPRLPCFSVAGLSAC